MARYIDAKELKKALSHFENEDAIYRDEIEMHIDDSPTADFVEVRHGKWQFAGDGIIECSVGRQAAERSA